MFKYLISLVLILVSSVAYANTFEIQFPVICGNATNLSQGLAERFSETKMFQANSKNEKDESLTHSFWLNFETKTWTFIVTNNDKEITCIIASGDKFEMATPEGTNI